MGVDCIAFMLHSIIILYVSVKLIRTFYKINVLHYYLFIINIFVLLLVFLVRVKNKTGIFT